MSVMNPISGQISKELDIVKVANELGIDHERLLAYVYQRYEAVKPSDESESASVVDSN
ncbi:hypothetical protein [Paenibacillus roseipurpureus]|uniref:Uncharacterized protein n=1 Tax=Paenibacillus roseopurpureus TaxID=2918901 RepID=A0AA96LK75_9BACL|nr:hypothetical protein [Paenibacillus sp. MBLB1832]WNR43275.1 hypothetical protein MJB10_19475 [Paenibacillus sp. MBLB1832]